MNKIKSLHPVDVLDVLFLYWCCCLSSSDVSEAWLSGISLRCVLQRCLPLDPPPITLFPQHSFLYYLSLLLSSSPALLFPNSPLPQLSSSPTLLFPNSPLAKRSSSLPHLSSYFSFFSLTFLSLPFLSLVPSPPGTHLSLPHFLFPFLLFPSLISPLIPGQWICIPFLWIWIHLFFSMRICIQMWNWIQLYKTVV